MRRRWRLQWNVELEELMGYAVLAWLGGGFIIWAVVAVVSAKGTDRVTKTAYIGLAIWLAPVALAGIVGFVWAFARLLVYVCRHPPLRRVTEPVRDDLRSAVQHLDD